MEAPGLEEGEGLWPCGRWREVLGLKRDHLEVRVRTYNGTRPVGISPLAEVHPRQDSSVAGHAGVSG